MLPVSGVTDHAPVVVAPLYCTDQFVRFTTLVPRLKSSMKSFRSGASAFPPPPYTWLITTSEATGGGASSLVMVPMPCPSATVAPFTPVRLTMNVSSNSTFVSPLTTTVNV